ncbi:MAG: tetratricopeptide repeat protein [Syntrophaceae bacterium]|nr:tetratricopeptide repeat protein [Syntrophaceae bacterium]
MKTSLSRKLIVFVIFLSMQVLACTNTPWHQKQGEIFLNKGISLIQMREFNSAAKELLEAEKYSPGDPKIHYYLGIAYHGKGLRSYAIEEFKKAISLKENYSEAHNYLGTLYMEMEQWDQALKEFDRALENIFYDTPAMPLFNAGLIYYYRKDYKNALIKYETALQKDPMTNLRPQIEKYIGFIYFDQNNIHEAILHFEQSVKLDPSLYDARFLLGECYLRIKDSKKARKEFQTVIELSPPSSTFSQKAKSYLQSLE